MRLGRFACCFPERYVEFAWIGAAKTFRQRHVSSSAVVNLIGSVLALHEFTEWVVDLVQSKEKRSPSSLCEDCLTLNGLVQDAYIVVALSQLDDSVVGDVEGLYVVSFPVEQIMTRERKEHCFYTDYRPDQQPGTVLWSSVAKSNTLLDESLVVDFIFCFWSSVLSMTPCWRSFLTR